MEQLSLAEAERIARAGAESLRTGNAAEAKASFERLVSAGAVNEQIRLLLAHSCRALGDRAGEEQALDALLAGDRDNLRALIMKGDCRQAAGDDRAASAFYSSAGRVAEHYPSLPPDLQAEVERAAAAAARNAAHYRTQLEERLGSTPQSSRFRESLALMFGEKEIYLQKPSAYYFPGLPQVQFYDPADFSWAAAIEAAAPQMRAELEAVLGVGGQFRPYLQAAKDRPNDDFHGMLGNPDWSTLHLFEGGKPVEENISRCPNTYEALQQAPLCHITVRAPSILFSLLKAGARIPPHHGMINTRLICHLPLIVPPGCGFRVGNEVREWEFGKLLIFDDTIEHEAWNESEEDRVVLIFDIWRPELTIEERAAVAAIFEVIDRGAT